jgi:hypothetical protein
MKLFAASVFQKFFTNWLSASFLIPYQRGPLEFLREPGRCPQCENLPKKGGHAEKKFQR